MKAAVIHEHGDLDRIGVEDIAPPRPGPGEVVVEVRSAGLNHLDIWVRKGRPGMALAMPHVLGSDAAGVVVELGSEAVGLDIDSEVIIDPGLSCGHCEFCLRGQQSECVSYGILGMSRSGTFAERVCVPARCLHAKPTHLTWDEAASLPLAYMTAWRMLQTRAKLAPGETVLIHGIGGGVALAALQLCKIVGAVVIVTSSSDEKLARASELGADHTINYQATKDVAQAVKEITGGRGADISVNSVGAAGWTIDFHALRRGGRIVVCGVTTGASAPTNLQALYWKQLTVLGSTMGSHEDLRQLLTVVQATGLRPVVDSVHLLDHARQATQRMEEGRQFGKIALKVGD
ncbi:MAG: zinc-binding dehydrogenase [Phycisphaerae bacterium]|nr:zinc-binding dehydrogenase [Phycisphaerae bacterium]